MVRQNEAGCFLDGAASLRTCPINLTTSMSQSGDHARQCDSSFPKNILSLSAFVLIFKDDWDKFPFAFMVKDLSSQMRM